MKRLSVKRLSGTATAADVEVEDDNDGDNRLLPDNVSVITESVGGGTEDSEDEVQQIKNLSSKETQSIRFWRFVVAFVIGAAGALVSTGTYLYITELEQKDARDAVRRR